MGTPKTIPMSTNVFQETLAFKQNLLLLRETLRVLVENSDTRMDRIYESFGMKRNNFDAIFDERCALSSNIIDNVCRVFTRFGLSPVYFKKKNATRILTHNKELDYYIDTYFDLAPKTKDVARKEKFEALSKMQEQIRNSLEAGIIHLDSNLSAVLLTCYRIIHEYTPDFQSTLPLATELLRQIQTYDFEKEGKEVLKTKEYGDFIKALSTTITAPQIELAGSHYNAQMALANVTILLQYVLDDFPLSPEDVTSPTALEMVKTFTDYMVHASLLVKEAYSNDSKK